MSALNMSARQHLNGLSIGLFGGLKLSNKKKIVNTLQPMDSTWIVGVVQLQLI